MATLLSRGAIPDRIQRIIRRGRHAARELHAWLPYHFAADGSAFAPLHVTLELTYLCNLRCRMCSLVRGGMVTRSGQSRKLCGLEHRRAELGCEDYETVLERLARQGTRAITITGGEPTLRPDLPRIVRAAKAARLHTYLISNGMADPSVYVDLVEAGVDAISISVDGDEPVHDEIRGFAGAFQRARAAIDAIAAARSEYAVGLDLSCTVSSVNARSLDPVLDLALEVRADTLVLGLLHFTTEENAAKTEGLLPVPPVHFKQPRVAPGLRGIDAEDLHAELQRLQRRGQDEGLEVRITPRLDVKGLRSHFSGEAPPPEAFCIQPWMGSRIDPWGELYPCWLDVRMGDAVREGVDVLWNGERYRELRKTIRKHGTLPKCASCPALAERTRSTFPWNLTPPGRGRTRVMHR